MLTDEQFFQWLMLVTRQIAERRDNAGPAQPSDPFADLKTYHVQDEGFSRWMGWRGEDEQEREIDSQRGTPAEWKEERLNRSYRKVWEENRDLKVLLRFIRDEIGKKIGP